MSTLQWIVVGCMVVGALFAIGSAREIWRRQSLLSKGVPVEGTVIDVKEIKTSWGKTWEPTVRYTPTVRYRDLSGQTYERHLDATGDQHRFEVGAKVWLLYQAQDPTNAVDLNAGLRNATTKLIASLLLVGLGVLLYSSVFMTPKP